MVAKYTREALERLLFRRQFILGPTAVTRLASWRTIDVGGGLCLTVHPDLEVEHAVQGDKSITLLGYAIDPLVPEANNLEVIRTLLDQLETYERLFQATDRFGGRWVLVVNDGSRVITFTDAAGMRQVFYTRGLSSDQIWCGSQPGLLAEALSLSIDADATAFVRTDGYLNKPWRWFPGDSTPYKEVKALLPNHYLDLGSGRVHRYWPREDLIPMSFNEAREASLKLLRGLMDGAHRRFKMSVAMTAGWDSRLVLAATRNMAIDTFYFTGIFPDMTAEHMDASAPSRLLASLGLKNNLIHCPSKVDDGLKRVFECNVSEAHREYTPIAQAMLEGCPPDTICTKGDVAEIVKCYHRLEDGSEITANALAKLTQMDPHPFVLNAFNEWLADARPRNVHLLDLFCWEQSIGRLEAMFEAEFDLVHDSFSPLNCREFLTNALRLDEKYRCGPSFLLFRALIEEMWPDALNEPINGQPQVGIKSVIRRAGNAIVPARLRRLVPRAMLQPIKRLLS